MLSRRSAVAVVLAIGFVQIAGDAAGQSREVNVLRGIKTFVVVAQDAAENDKACGMDPEAAKATATKALVDGGLQAGSGKEASDAGLGIRFATLHFASAAVCVSSIKVDISARGFATFAFAAEPVKTWIMLEEQIALISSPRADHPARFIQKIKELSETLAGHVRVANQ